MVEAIRVMTQAIDAESPQQSLLTDLLALLAEQERLNLALEARVRGLLPELADPEPDSGATGYLGAVSDVVTRLRWNSWILPDIEARIGRLLELPAPQEVASSHMADTFDFSRDTLVRAQFIHVRDHTEQVPDSLVLRAALDGYDAEVMRGGVALFTAETTEYGGRPAELQASGSIRDAGAAVFREGLRHLLPSASGGADSGQPPGDPAPAGPGTAGAPGETSVARLVMRDVFDLAPGSRWWASARAYLPVFTFVVGDIRALGRLDQAWASLRADVPGLRSGIAGAPAAGPAARTALWPGAHGSPAEVISELTGPKIAGIVRARRLTWCGWDCHRELAGVITDAGVAVLRLASGIDAGLARERAAYLARIGRVPRLDAAGNRGMARVAAELRETSRRHVRLAWALLAEGEAIRRAGRAGAEPPDTARLRAALRTAEEAIVSAEAAIAAGSYLEAARRIAAARLPLRPGSFPGHVFHHDLLAQARPLAVLAIANRMAVARWAGLALAAYFHTRETTTDMVSRHVADYARAHEQAVLAANAAIAVIGAVAAG